MASRGRAFVVGALLVGVMGVGYAFGQAAPVGGEQKAVTTRPAASQPVRPVLSVVPADAWGVVGINDLKKFDESVADLGGKLGLPMFFIPSGMIQMGLGVTEGFNPRGGLAIIVLNKMKYPEARGWEMAENVPVPMVLAVPATDPKVMIQAMGGKPGEEEAEGTFRVTVANEEVSAVAKGGYVLFSPDPTLVKAVAASGATATQPVVTTMQPDLVKQIDDANLFVMVNGKAVLESVDPIVRGMLGMMAASMQAPTAGTPNPGMLFSAYYDILSKQLDKLVVLGHLKPEGVTVSGLLTFQKGTLLSKICAAAKPSAQPLVSSLPDGQFVLAGGSIQSGAEFGKELSDLFNKPVLDMLKTMDEEKAKASLEQQTKITEAQLQLQQLQKTMRVAIYAQPDGKAGLISVVLSGQFTDAAKAYDLVKQVVKTQVEVASKDVPMAKGVLDAFTYAETDASDTGKAYSLTLDLAKLQAGLPEISENDVEEATKVTKVLFGEETPTVRIAMSDKDIVMVMGGGPEMLKKALAMAKSGAAPLAKQEAMAKIQDRLPKSLQAAMFISAENGLNAYDQIAKALEGEPLPFKVGPTSAPLVGMVLADPVGAHLGVYVPTELMQSVRGLVGQAQMHAHEPAMEEESSDTPASSGTQAEPKPEF